SRAKSDKQASNPKRQSTALQNLRNELRARISARFWSAAVLCRFGNIAASQSAAYANSFPVSKRPLQKPYSFHSDFIAGGFDATPDRRRAGDDFDVGSKRFDHKIAFVTDVFQGFSNWFPINVVVARSAAVAAAGMEMAEKFARLANGGSL